MEDIKAYSDMGIEKLTVVEDVLKKAPPGFFLEVGTRLGGTAMLAMRTMPQGSHLISVDPYGSKTYYDKEGVAPFKFSDEMYLTALKGLSSFALAGNYSFTQYKMTSLDFLTSEAMLYIDGESRPLETLRFSYVLLDGEHVNNTVGTEIEILKDRMVTGGIILVDNIDWLTLDFNDWTKPRFDMAYKIL